MVDSSAEILLYLLQETIDAFVNPATFARIRCPMRLQPLSLLLGRLIELLVYVMSSLHLVMMLRLLRIIKFRIACGGLLRLLLLLLLLGRAARAKVVCVLRLKML